MALCVRLTKSASLPRVAEHWPNVRWALAVLHFVQILVGYHRLAHP